MGAQKIQLFDEPMSGIVTGYISDKDRVMLISTKSGGFGDKYALDELIDYMWQIQLVGR